MRILTVRQPWAWAITRGQKNVENRSRDITGGYRGPVAIHAGLKRFDPRDAAGGRVAEITGYRPLMFLPQGYGHIVAVVDLIGTHEDRCSTRGDEPCGGCCSLWADHDMWHLELANPRPLTYPIPFKGALGLRHLDAETITRIEAQL